MAIASLGANAGFIKGDLNSVGDQLSAVDTETGIEWINLTQTKGMSINQVQGLLETTFNGWRLPTRFEVNLAMNHATQLITQDNGSVTYAIGSNEMTGLLNAFGQSRTGSSYGTHGVYLNDDPNGSPVLSSGGYLKSSTGFGTFWDDDNHSSYTTSFAYSFLGVFLVSDGGVTISSIKNPSLNANNPNSPSNISVPLPATSMLLSLGLISFGFRKKNQLIDI